MQQREQQVWKQKAAEAAAELIEDGMVIGLGTGSTAAFLTQALARRIEAGLRIRGAVPTSHASADLARSLNIPLVTLEDYPELDMDIDGADEIDQSFSLIKGGGGALLREKIVASASRQFIVIADITKMVTHLGLRSPLPIEVIPFARPIVQRQLEALNATVRLRLAGDVAFITDNYNQILDCTFPQGITDPLLLQTRIRQIVGVVDTGLFINLASGVLIGGPNGVQYAKNTILSRETNCSSHTSHE